GSLWGGFGRPSFFDFRDEKLNGGRGLTLCSETRKKSYDRGVPEVSDAPLLSVLLAPLSLLPRFRRQRLCAAVSESQRAVPHELLREIAAVARSARSRKSEAR